MPQPLRFPLWVFVNEKGRPKDGYPYYLCIRGGPRTNLPATLGVYSTPERAEPTDPGYPFTLVEIDSAAFYEALSQHLPGIEQVVLDLGTEHAVLYRAEELLGRTNG